MKQLIFLSILSATFILAMSCNRDDDMSNKNNDGAEFDCIFVQDDNNINGLIDDTEKSIMLDCAENKYTSKNEIEQNLIGEWELIGHGEGWVPVISQPYGYIIILEEELIFEFRNIYIDTVGIYS